MNIQQKTNKQLFIILGATIVIGFIAFYLGKSIDSSVAEISDIKHQVDEKTRYAIDRDTRVAEMESVQTYTKYFETSLTGSDDVINILEELERMAQDAEIELTINLEEGTIGEGEIEFQDEQEKIQFLNSLTVEEYSPQDTQPEEPQQIQPGENLAAQVQEQPEQTNQEILTISFLEMDVSTKGSYEQIRLFITMLQRSKFFFSIGEIRILRDTELDLEATLNVRAFLFDKNV